MKMISGYCFLIQLPDVHGMDGSLCCVLGIWVTRLLGYTPTRIMPYRGRPNAHIMRLGHIYCCELVMAKIRYLGLAFPMLR